MKQLFAKFLRMNLSQDEIGKLRDYTNNHEDKLIEEIIEVNWNEYSTRSMDKFTGITLSEPKVERVSKYRNLFRVAIGAIAASILLLVGVLTDSDPIVDSNIGKDYIVATKSAQRSTLLLPDGTTVELNNATKVAYNSNFGVNNRDIQLSGEAYFDVAHNTEKPFTVIAGKMRIEVTGTRFNIMAYDNEETTVVTLIEGSVTVLDIDDPAHIIHLTPNERAIMDNRTGIISMLKVEDTENDLVWQRDEILIRSRTFPQIIKELERRYAKDILLEGDVSEEKFSGRFKSDNIEGVLDILQGHYQFDYIADRDEIRIVF